MSTNDHDAATAMQSLQPASKYFRPLGNRLLVKRDDAATMTPGGLHIPAATQSKSDRGTVRYVGPGGVDATSGKYIPVTVKPGDVVIFPRSAIELDVGGEKLVLLQEPEVFAVEFSSAEGAAAFGVGEAAVLSRRRRSDAGVKRGKRRGQDEIVADAIQAVKDYDTLRKVAALDKAAV